MGDPCAGMTSPNTIAECLESAQEECERLRRENARLRAMLGVQDSVSKELGPTTTPVLDVLGSDIAAPTAPEKKIALFEVCFAVEKTFTPYAGRERVASPARSPSSHRSTIAVTSSDGGQSSSRPSVLEHSSRITAAVLRNELFWIWVPAGLLAAGASFVRRQI